MKVEAVIFDLDGTLIDSIGGIAFALNRVLTENGFPVHSIETCKQLVGNGFVDLVRRAVPEEHRSEAEIQRYVSQLRAEYDRHWDYGMRVYDGIEDLLVHLQSRGIPFAVDTNKDEGVARRIVERYLSRFKFFRVSGTTPGMPKKPDPARALEMAAGMGVTPRRCIYLGDSEVDIMTAKKAGMIQISAAWGFRSPDDLCRAGAERIIHKPMDLVSCLE
ncbi:HAD family hydrolase [Thermoclostridium caenicola]|uniref:Phosphoglycolate phosphatase n=1 Tax=Thermoclostridium caenicola TaxID=659425 RepID=A0A1M6GE90_9FIRM|nr:HAD family hydrolase [Thermoclostridium caenicola]SHJ08285.1 phosphoglycolate phosphatase [Thermoclostridium caenicola]HOP72428.1 HAD family hydrolase [Thermoclostridium caenicola]